MEYNLVEMWLRKDPIRWVSGAFAGLLAGLVAMAVSMFIAQTADIEGWFPIKLVGSILLGASATETGNSSGILTGVLLISGLTMFLGMVYAHFTGTNFLGALLPMGLVWGTFSWIFIWNLFLQSFPTIFAAHVPSGIVFGICLAFGLSLASVAFFDSLLRGKTKGH